LDDVPIKVPIRQIGPIGILWQNWYMKKIIPITIALQVIGIFALGIVYLLKPTGGDPGAPFTELQMFVKKYGPPKAVNALGNELLQRAKYLCNREQCIQNKFRGNRGNYITLASASRRDPCQSYRASDCDVTKIRMELTRVLKYVDSCNIEGKVKIKNRVRIRVKCGSVSDFVSVMPNANGTGWRITADEKYPGLLPNLYKGSRGGNR